MPSFEIRLIQKVKVAITAEWQAGVVVRDLIKSLCDAVSAIFALECWTSVDCAWMECTCTPARRW